MTAQTLLQETIDKFSRVSLFQAFRNSSEALEQIARLFTTIRCEAGCAVITEGETGDAMYIVKSGTVEIVKKTKQGDPYTVAELSSDKNMFFGEMALIDQDRRSAGVLCKTPCEFYMLTRENFLSLGDSHPAIGLALTRELAKILCNRLRKANSDVITLFDALVGEVAESGGLE
jgi:CRP/FNR family transcriptional regulator, cyclic AMP receptor protein